jgi:hypothetical protein
MKKLISAKTAGNILLGIFAALILFHILILFNLLPSGIVWGGQAENSAGSLRIMEVVSLVFTILFAVIVAAKIGYIKLGISTKILNILLWIIFAYLILNTLGNLASSSSTEKLIFTPLTIIAALLVFRLAKEK